MVYVDTQGGLKRCGGQGDILAGCLGTFAGWAKIYHEEHPDLPATSKEGDGFGVISQDRLLLLAGFGAAVTARVCSRLAFGKKKRAMLADDLLPEVGEAYEQLWGDNSGLNAQNPAGIVRQNQAEMGRQHECCCSVNQKSHK